MMPTVLVGSFVGVLVNILMPGVVLSIILTAFLLFLSFQTLFKALQIFKKENIKRKEAKEAQEKANKNGTAAGLGGTVSPPGSNSEKYGQLWDSEGRGKVTFTRAEVEYMHKVWA